MAEPAYLVVDRTTQGVQWTGERITLRGALERIRRGAARQGRKAGNAELRDEVAFFRPR
ncbi:MAG: hypothetical protein QOH37_3789, partial [Nocardioidaceae bacterium]|nr:hypothetical protein [Nocardioidaceae bacterium]